MLQVDVLEEGVHSGSGSGIVPSSFRVARALLSRLEDEIGVKALASKIDTQIAGALGGALFAQNLLKKKLSAN